MTCSFPDQGDCTCHGQDLVADRMRSERDAALADNAVLRDTLVAVSHDIAGVLQDIHRALDWRPDR